MNALCALRGARNLSVAALLPAALILSGCSGEPSASQVEKAVLESYAKEAIALRQVSGSMANRLIPELHGVRKLACNKLNDASYACDVELEMTAPGASQRSKGPTNVTVVKTSDGWVAKPK